MKCPYCKKDGVKPPKKNEVRPHGTCQNCGKKPRATVANIGGVDTVIKYSAEGKSRHDKDSVKSKKYQLRLSKDDERCLELGKKEIILTEGKNGKTLVLSWVV